MNVYSAIDSRVCPSLVGRIHSGDRSAVTALLPIGGN